MTFRDVKLKSDDNFEAEGQIPLQIKKSVSLVKSGKSKQH